MSSAITAPTYDPTSTAQSLATKSTADAQQTLTNKTNAANATATALTQLGSAISTFQNSLATLGSVGKSILAQSATLSNSAFGSATAKSSAAAGTYSLFVQQVATAGKVSYDNVPDATTASGTLTVNVGSATPINIDLSAANTDGGTLSVREIAAAINNASGNTGLVSAGVITVPVVNGDGTTSSQMRLVLTSKNTGAASNISLSTTSQDLQSTLGSQPTSTTAGKDAIVLLDAQYKTVTDPSTNTTTTQLTGTQVTQASNTFTNIDGVAFTATRAQATGDDPITLTVGTDSNATAANAQAFVDAYNKLKNAVDGMLDPGDTTNNKAAGAFANDSGVKALQTRLVDLLRPATGGLSLASYGITASRDGSLTLDSTRLNKQLALNPGGLDQLMGSASTGSPSGVMGNLNSYLNLWTDSANGQIQQRTSANTKLQSDLSKRQDNLTTQYNDAYNRYLKQFTDLQTLQAQMNNNVSMFDAIFGSDKSS
ncbi:flagellar filament capping protein FliD [Massilia sp. 9096]|uniref:flagellar filament capping protein FliD n=1 Tax=Massilia sp. 9096 TaxID=1500894 RepID=UPI000561D6C6|nr:flagellar filament capping protein FliD [Massilia sp. 9096]